MLLLTTLFQDGERPLGINVLNKFTSVFEESSVVLNSDKVLHA